MQKVKGFTLVELLITISIIGIVAAIAIPSYSAYLVRGKIAEATSTLSDGRIKMEQFFQDNRTYALGPAPAATKYFTYATSDTPTTAGTPTVLIYAIKATGTVSMAGFVYAIDQNNIKWTVAAPAGWAAAVMPTNCWILKQNGQC